jgi:hypothetical protein
MRRISRGTLAQGAATATVLVAGIVLTATGGGAAVAATHRTPARHVAASTPVAPAAPATAAKPSHHRPAPQLRHPAHESWSKLLASTPHGWSVIHGPSPLSRKTLSAGFKMPSVVSRDLRFNGYRRGVIKAVRGAKVGRVEQLWQFGRPTGAKAWFASYFSSNRPSKHSEFSHMALVGRHGNVAFLSHQVDASGYHFGVGMALEGDIVIHVEVFSIAAVSRNEIATQLRRATRPVARGITAHGFLSGPAVHLHTPSLTT